MSRLGKRLPEKLLGMSQRGSILMEGPGVLLHHPVLLLGLIIWSSIFEGLLCARNRAGLSFRDHSWEYREGAQKNDDSKSPGGAGSSPEVNRTPNICLLSTWMAMELAPLGVREELMQPDVCKFEQKRSAESVVGRTAVVLQLRHDRTGFEGRVCPVSAQMNSRVRRQRPFLDGFFKPAFIN